MWLDFEINLNQSLGSSRYKFSPKGKALTTYSLDAYHALGRNWLDQTKILCIYYNISYT